MNELRSGEHPRARFAIRIEEGNPHGDVFELEQTMYFHIVEIARNEVVMTFRGDMEARFAGNGMWEDHQYSGVKAVSIAPGEQSVLVTYHDGREEVVALPMPT
jgi:hypothetical protein